MADSAQDPASFAPGPNISRRRFVEIALGAVGGATLVGLRATPASAAEASARRPHVRACDGEAVPSEVAGGYAGEVIEPEDQRQISRQHP
jgi:hypothetical protein